MRQDEYQVAVIGGGITGLSAAYYLQQEAKKQNKAVQITLFEATSRLGGKVQTLEHDGFVIETGPDSFLKRKTSAVDLIQELGLAGDLVSNQTGQSYILKKGRLFPIPEDAAMGIPTRIKPFLTTRLLSPLGKARAAWDLFLPRSSRSGDQSVGAFFRRRLGDELVESLIEPLLSGIYASDIDRLSLESTFPHFQKVENEHRSLILGMKHATAHAPARPKAKKEGQFATLRRGLGSMVQSLEQALATQTIIKNAKIAGIKRSGDAYQIHLSDGETCQADSVVLAVPHHRIQALFPFDHCFDQIHEVPSTTVGNVTFAFSEGDLPQLPSGTGFVVTRTEKYQITACTWTHKKWPHTTPNGKLLLRCYLGRPNDHRILELSDQEIVQAVMNDLSQVLPMKKQPEFYHVTRWKNAMPQYLVGHQKRVQRLRRDVANYLPGVHLAGASYEGVGIGDCIAQGKKAALTVLEQMKGSPSRIEK